MHPDLAAFLAILEKEDRQAALQFALTKLSSGQLTILSLYEDILASALNMMTQENNENVNIWREHVRTSIVKTILENAYPFVIRERDASVKLKGKTVAVLCPPEEYHDVGARMAADVFTLSGYNAIFVGGNTPQRVVEGGLESGAIDYIAISVSNPYHLIATRNMIEGIRTQYPAVKVVVGGHAIDKIGERSLQLGADYVVYSLGDISKLEEVQA